MVERITVTLKNDQRISIYDINDTTVTEAFLELYNSFLDGKIDLERLNMAAYEFFNRIDGTPDASALQDAFFNNYGAIWRPFLDHHQYLHAEKVWEGALQPVLDWERQNSGHFIHKGTPFYFWGIIAILKGDLDKGFMLIHQAVSEDRRTQQTPLPGTPAFALVTLNYAKDDQAFRDWVQEQAQKLGIILQTYCTNYGRTLTLDDFRQRFLIYLANTNIDFVFSFVYVLAKLNQFHDIPAYTLKNDFASQMEINLLFGLTRVIDAALKVKNPQQWKFSDHIVFLSDRAQLGITQNQCGMINGRFNNDFDLTIRDLLTNASIFPTQQPPNIGNDIALAYGLRNHAAHNISSAPSIQENFDEILQRIFNMLFFTVETLY